MTTRKPQRPIHEQGVYINLQPTKWEKFKDKVDTIGYTCLLFAMYPVGRIYAWVRGVKW